MLHRSRTEREISGMTDEVTVAANIARPRKQKVTGSTAALPTTVPDQVPVGQAATEQLASELEQLADMMEADPSPAVQSDAMSAPADAAAPIEELKEMATIASPTETTDKAQAVFGDFSERFKTAFEKSSKLGEDMVDFAKGNVEAVIASARVAAKASETLGQEAAEYGKKNFETATAAFKSFATVKSPTELFQLQSEFAKAQFDSVVAEASKVSETMLKLAGDIAQPLSNRYALAAEKFKANTL
jgi:phasin family protein